MTDPSYETVVDLWNLTVLQRQLIDEALLRCKSTRRFGGVSLTGISLALENVGRLYVETPSAHKTRVCTAIVEALDELPMGLDPLGLRTWKEEEGFDKRFAKLLDRVMRGDGDIDKIKAEIIALFKERG